MINWLSNIFSFIKTLRVSWGVAALAAMAIMSIAGGFYILSLRLDLAVTARDSALLERDAAIAESLRWKSASEAYTDRAEGLRALALNCLEREKNASADAAARAIILRNLKPVPLTGESEGANVAARRLAVERLNRAY
jgi:hypothetical protein